MWSPVLMVAHKCHTTFESNMSNPTTRTGKIVVREKILYRTSKKLCCATFAQHNIFSRTTIFPVRVVGHVWFKSSVALVGHHMFWRHFSLWSVLLTNSSRVAKIAAWLVIATTDTWITLSSITLVTVSAVQARLRHTWRISAYRSPMSPLASRQRLRSASSNQLVVPRHRRTQFGRRAFSVAGLMVWNALPDSIRDTALSTHSFRRNLKTLLFSFY